MISKKSVTSLVGAATTMALRWRWSRPPQPRRRHSCHPRCCCRSSVGSRRKVWRVQVVGWIVRSDFSFVDFDQLKHFEKLALFRTMLY